MCIPVKTMGHVIPAVFILTWNALQKRHENYLMVAPYSASTTCTICLSTLRIFRSSKHLLPSASDHIKSPSILHSLCTILLTLVSPLQIHLLLYYIGQDCILIYIYFFLLYTYLPAMESLQCDCYLSKVNLTHTTNVMLTNNYTIEFI